MYLYAGVVNFHANETSSFTRESGALMHLSVPIILTQIATQAMGFVDTTMAGQVSPADLAAIALGTSLDSCIAATAWGDYGINACCCLPPRRT